MTRINKPNELQEKKIDAKEKDSKETSRHHNTIEKHNISTKWLTVAIIILAVCTLISQLFPIYTYEVIGNDYMVRINKFTGKVKYLYVTEELHNAEYRYMDAEDEKYKNRKGR